MFPIKIPGRSLARILATILARMLARILAMILGRIVDMMLASISDSSAGRDGRTPRHHQDSSYGVS